MHIIMHSKKKKGLFICYATSILESSFGTTAVVSHSVTAKVDVDQIVGSPEIDSIHVYV